MRGPYQRFRWTALVGGTGALTALAALIVIVAGVRREERRAADAGIALAVAGYLSLVTSTVPQSGEYQLPALLSAANTLASSPGWHTRLQVAWRTAPLLHDSIGLTPLDPPTNSSLVDGYRTIHVRRSVGEVSLAPLFDGDLRNVVGWVAIWGSVPSQAVSPLILSLGLVTLVAIVLAIHYSRPAEPPRRRWTAAAIGVVLALVLTLGLGQQTQRIAELGTDAVLARVQYLAERVATIPRVPESQLSRIAPGLGSRILPSRPRLEGVGRRVNNGEPIASVEVPLRSGRILEITMVPREARLAGMRAALLAGVGFIGLSLAFGAWAGAALHNRGPFRETRGIGMGGFQ